MRLDTTTASLCFILSLATFGCDSKTPSATTKDEPSGTPGKVSLPTVSLGGECTPKVACDSGLACRSSDLEPAEQGTCLPKASVLRARGKRIIESWRALPGLLPAEPIMQAKLCPQDLGGSLPVLEGAWLTEAQEGSDIPAEAIDIIPSMPFGAHLLASPTDTLMVSDLAWSAKDLADIEALEHLIFLRPRPAGEDPMKRSYDAFVMALGDAPKPICWAMVDVTLPGEQGGPDLAAEVTSRALGARMKQIAPGVRVAVATR